MNKDQIKLATDVKAKMESEAFQKLRIFFDMKTNNFYIEGYYKAKRSSMPLLYRFNLSTKKFFWSFINSSCDYVHNYKNKDAASKVDIITKKIMGGVYA